MTEIYVIFQKNDSRYNDLEWECYEYPENIPNGLKLKPGDLVVFDLTSKEAKKIHGEKSLRLIGIAEIGKITEIQKDGNSRNRLASYNWVYRFPEPIKYDDIGGTIIRKNNQHSICGIKDDYKLNILKYILKLNK
jgi:hypothetical protein